MLFKLKILGSSAGVPAYHRFSTAQILEVGSRLYLIDAGEGVQMRLNEYGISKSKISAIFVSHLHGDHYYGLIGLLSSMSMNGRKTPLDVFSPAGLEAIITLQLSVSESVLSYPVTFHIIDTSVSQTIYEDETVCVQSLPLLHRVPTTGFIFKEHPRQLNMNPKKISEYNIPFGLIPDIKNGSDFLTADGLVVPNNELTFTPPTPRSFAYCSDTLYSEDIIPEIKGVSILFHEATFMHDMLENAKFGMHTTAQQAGKMAALAEVKNLVIGHISARYLDANCLLSEAKNQFSNTHLGEDGFEVEVPFR